MKKRIAQKIANNPTDKYGIARYKRNRIVKAINVVLANWDMRIDNFGLYSLLWSGLSVSQIMPRRGSDPRCAPTFVAVPQHIIAGASR